MRIADKQACRFVMRPLVKAVAVACAIVICLSPQLCVAQNCPGPGASLKAITDAVSDLHRNGRAPAGADCAYGWAVNYDLSTSTLESDAVRLFRAAADVQRKASEMRRAAGAIPDANVYLDQEIELRQLFLKEVIGRSPEEVAQLRSEVIRHLSYFSGALAFRGEYKRIAESLGDKEPGLVDNEALKVWLQAVWSCAQWDGNKRNPCADPDRQNCKDQVEVFLASLDGMGTRSLPPQTRTDIARLRPLVAPGGCLQ